MKTPPTPVREALVAVCLILAGCETAKDYEHRLAHAGAQTQAAQAELTKTREALSVAQADAIFNAGERDEARRQLATTTASAAASAADAAEALRLEAEARTASEASLVAEAAKSEDLREELAAAQATAVPFLGGAGSAGLITALALGGRAAYLRRKNGVVPTNEPPVG